MKLTPCTARPARGIFLRKRRKHRQRPSGILPFFSVILLGDRGLESYNNMAHLQEKGWKFVIRVKDGSNGIASGLDRPETEEYDLSINLSLTRSQTNDVQEVFARLTMYNFAELITSSVVIRKGRRKLSYMVNFSAAAHVCRNFFLGNVSPPEVEALISRYLSPVRPDRKFPRRPTVRSGFSFLYRLPFGGFFEWRMEEARVDD